MKQNSVCCVIVTYNIGKDFYKCFNSIINQVEDVIIVDNASDKNTIDVLRDLESKWDIKVVYNEENYGIAVALNIGVKYALENNYKWLLTMDNDSEATENMIESMLNTYNNAKNNTKNIVSIFPKYVEKGFCDCNINVNSSVVDLGYSDVECEITSGNLIKCNTFVKLGLFKEEYFIDYVDHEFCLRILSNGYKLIRAEGAVLLHSLGNSKKVKVLGKELTYTNHSALRRYYITRNRMHVWNKYKKTKNSFIRHDKSAFNKELLKIVAFEDDKINKIKSLLKGIRDYKSNKFNKI